MTFKSQQEFIGWLKAARFPTPEMKCEKGIGNIIDVIKELESKRGSFTFETDGAVIKVNDFDLQKKVGVKTKRAALGDSSTSSRPIKPLRR